MKSSPYQHSLILGWCGSTRAYIQVGKVKPNANNTYSLMGAVFGAKWDYEGRDCRDGGLEDRTKSTL
jgi:hypothetical protein